MSVTSSGDGRRGSASDRRELYSETAKGDLILLSYATAAADRQTLIDLSNELSVMLVVDESHRVKRFRGGLWAPSLVSLAKHSRVRMILTGTPMPQGGRDLYSQLNILWPGQELTGSRDAFATNVVLMVAGFVLAGNQMLGYVFYS